MRGGTTGGSRRRSWTCRTRRRPTAVSSTTAAWPLWKDEGGKEEGGIGTKDSSCSSFILSPSLLARRYLSLCALLFWQGGFLFYTSSSSPSPAGSWRASFICGRRSPPRPPTGSTAPALWSWPCCCGTWLPRLILPRAAEQGPRRLLGGVVFHPGRPVRPALLDGSTRPARYTAAPSDRFCFRRPHTLYVAAVLVQSVAALVYLGLAVMPWARKMAKLARLKEVTDRGEEEKERKG